MCWEIHLNAAKYPNSHILYGSHDKKYGQGQITTHRISMLSKTEYLIDISHHYTIIF